MKNIIIIAFLVFTFLHVYEKNPDMIDDAVHVVLNSSESTFEQAIKKIRIVKAHYDIND